jgi:hypothetical protein
MNKKNITILLIILILVLGLGFILMNKEKDQTPPPEEIGQEEIDTSDWETFRDEELGIEFKYPENIKINNDESHDMLYISAGLPWPQRGTSLTVSRTDQTIDQFIVAYNNSDVLDDGIALAKIFEQKNYNLNDLKGTLLKGSTAIGIDKGVIFIIANQQNYIIEFMDELTVEESGIINSLKFIN